MKKRILSFTLAILLLLPFSLFASCKKEEATTAYTVDLSEYKIIIENNATDILRDSMQELCDSLGAALGTSVKRAVDREKETVQTDDKEILIGTTSRAESGESLAKIGGDGYAICATENKIVLVGTSDWMTVLAIENFITKYADALTAPTSFTVEKEKVVSDYPVLVIDSSWKVVYDGKLDDVVGSSYGSKYSKSYGNADALDYPVVAAAQVAENIKSALTLPENLSVGKDSESDGNHEIIVGITERTVSKELFAKLDADQYGICATEQGIAIVGHNDVMLEEAISGIPAFFKASNVKTESGTEIRIPVGSELISDKKGESFDFPRPNEEGVVLSGSLDVGDGSTELYYNGAVSKDVYEDYCVDLEAAGYTLYAANEIEGNFYRTYLNSAKKKTLHVTLSLFPYAEEQNVSQFEPCIRITVASTDSVNLLPAEMFSPNYNYEKLTDTKITTMLLSYEGEDDNFGSCYIITLEDGRFIMIDGGGSGNASDTVRLFNVLSDLFNEVYGHQPTANDPIVIAAWYLTHMHADHYANFNKMCAIYGEYIRLEKVIASFTSQSETFNAYDINHTLSKNFSTLSDNVGGTAYYKMHTGWKFYIANVELEVLYTHEEYFPYRIDFFNETSTVIRMTVNSTDGAGHTEGEATTALWLGDLYKRGSAWLRASYGSYLQSDMCQVAHHGARGCEAELYDLVSPICFWWPTGVNTYNKYMKYPTKSETYIINNHLAKDIPSVQYIIVSDEYNTTVRIDKDGPHFAENELFDAYTHQKISYGNAIVKK